MHPVHSHNATAPSRHQDPRKGRDALPTEEPWRKLPGVSRRREARVSHHTLESISTRVCRVAHWMCRAPGGHRREKGVAGLARELASSMTVRAAVAVGWMGVLASARPEAAKGHAA